MFIGAYAYVCVCVSSSWVLILNNLNFVYGRLFKLMFVCGNLSIHWKSYHPFAQGNCRSFHPNRGLIDWWLDWCWPTSHCMAPHKNWTRWTVWGETQGRLSSPSKYCENVFRFNFDLIDTIKLQFCTCHDSSAVMACAKLWTDQIIILWVRPKYFFSQDLAHKPFVKWAPDGGHDIGNPSDTQISWLSLHSYQNAMLQWMLDCHRPVNGVIIGSDHDLVFSSEKI